MDLRADRAWMGVDTTATPVVKPEPGELGELVRDLCSARRHWMPSGLGNHLHWGPSVSVETTTLSMARCNRLLEHAVSDFTVTVEAGLPLQVLQQELGRTGQWLAVDPPPGEGDSSIGGLVARGISGGLQHRYPGIRDQLIGLSLWRADGVAAKAGGRVVKNVAGYDLMRLFSGSWGSLGLMQTLTLRTYPLPPARCWALVQGPFAELARLRAALLRSSLTPERVDWWSESLARRHRCSDGGAGPLLCIGLASIASQALDDQLAALSRLAPSCLRLEAAEQDPSGSAAAWQPERGGWLLRLGCPGADPVALLDPASGDPHGLTGGELCWGAATGLADLRLAASVRPAAVADLRRRCRAAGGFLVVLQAPDQAAREAVPSTPPDAVSLAIKAAFDPLKLLSPGRLPGGP